MRARTLTTLLFSLLLAAPAAAQVRIVGRVIDDVTERPLGDAAITLLATDGLVLARSETADEGTFEFEVDKVPAIRLEVHRLSYKANVTPVLHFDGRNYFQVEIRLDPDAILLAPLEIIARSEVDPSPFFNDLRLRLRTGNGFYITREEIEARRPAVVSDLLRTVPGVTVTGAGSGLRPKVELARAVSRGDCSTQIWVDGMLMNKRWGSGRNTPSADFRVDDLVTPASVEAIEVYGGLATVPAQFLNDDAKCGVIAIWTRRGGRGGGG